MNRSHDPYPTVHRHIAYERTTFRPLPRKDSCRVMNLRTFMSDLVDPKKVSKMGSKSDLFH